MGKLVADRSFTVSTAVGDMADQSFMVSAGFFSIPTVLFSLLALVAGIRQTKGAAILGCRPFGYVLCCGHLVLITSNR